MSIAEFSVNRPVTTIMIMVSVVVLGVISYTKMPMMFLPDMSFPSLNVSVPYPSSSPDEVERLIARPLEDAFGTLSNLKSMESTSGANDARGDVFVSIHANATPDPEVRGIETFFLALDASDDSGPASRVSVPCGQLGTPVHANSRFNHFSARWVQN